MTKFPVRRILIWMIVGLTFMSTLYIIVTDQGDHRVHSTGAGDIWWVEAFGSSEEEDDESAFTEDENQEDEAGDWDVEFPADE